jgi:hypothetical protein
MLAARTPSEAGVQHITQACAKLGELTIVLETVLCELQEDHMAFLGVRSEVGHS